jgi:hypothetical protein
MYPSEWDESDDERIKSVVNKTDPTVPTGLTASGCGLVNCNTAAVDLPAAPAIPSAGTAASVSAALTSADPVPGTSTTPASTPASAAPAPLPAQILEALGDPKAKDEPLGPKIQEEISKRWGRVLVDGLNKEQRQALHEKFLFPENFKLAKAPLLNPEIAPVLSEPVRNRDNLLQKSQNVLGRGISGLTNLTSSLIDEDTDKVEIIRKLSEITQIFLDLHHDNTKTRRKLIITSLDKKFTSMISDVKRDEFLFGSNLNEKIKASKTAERSGLQVRRSDSGPSRRQIYHHSGNWRGPPRHQGSSKPRRGGPRNRYWPQTTRRQPPTAQRPSESSKPGPKQRRP